MNKMKDKGGYITAITLMVFLILTATLVTTSILVVNNFRANRSIANRDDSFYVSDYGLNKAKSTIIKAIATSSSESRETWLKDIDSFVEYVNEMLLDEVYSDEDLEFTVNFELINADEDIFKLTSVATVEDATGAMNYVRTTSIEINNVIEAFGDKEFTEAWPEIDAALTVESSPTLSGGTITGKVMVIDPKPNGIVVKQSFNQIKDAIDADGNVTPGKIYIYSNGGMWTYENVHTLFTFEGMPSDDSKARMFFETYRDSSGRAHLGSPRLDKIEIFDEEYLFPTVRGIKDTSYITKKAEAYTTPAGTSLVNSNAELTFPQAAWNLNESTVTYKLTENARYSSINIPKSYFEYFYIDVGDKDIEIVTDKLFLDGAFTLKGTGTLTIFISDKYMNTPTQAAQNVRIDPTRLTIADKTELSDNRRVAIVYDTPDSFEASPIKVTLQPWSNTASLTVVAKHMDLRVVGLADINALSWGKNSKATVQSSSTFSSNLFYFKEGTIDYQAQDFRGGLIAKEVNMENSSPSITNDNSISLVGFPLEIDWTTPSGKPGSSQGDVILGEAQEGRLEFGRASEVRD